MLTKVPVAQTENQLIEALPIADRRALLAVSEPFELVMEEVLIERGQVMRHVYFPIDGFVSMVTQVDSHEALEVGMIGREGMVGVNLALGVSDAPLRALVQGPGVARRVSATAFARLLSGSAAMRRCIHRYVHVLMAQQSESAACLRFHQIGPRLARWMLMTHDRAYSDRFHVTHEFLAYMLGVRRVGITTAAMGLQRRGLIAYSRGEVVVLDRPGLEAAACICYAIDRQIYVDHMAHPAQRTG